MNEQELYRPRSTSASPKVSGDAAQDSPSLAELDAHAGRYESGPDDNVAVRYHSDDELLTAMRRRRSGLTAD